MMYFLYVLECADGSLYTGVAKDPAKRFAMHAAGNGAKYTRQHKPLRIVYTEKYMTQGAALRREYQLKGWTRRKKTLLVQGKIADVAQG